MKCFIETNGNVNKNVKIGCCAQFTKLSHICISIAKPSSLSPLHRHYIGQQKTEASRQNLNSQLEGQFLCFASSLTYPSCHPQNLLVHATVSAIQPHHLETLPHHAPTHQTIHVHAFIDLYSLSQIDRNLPQHPHLAASQRSHYGPKIEQCCFTAITMHLASAIEIRLEALSPSSGNSPILTLQAQLHLENVFLLMNEAAEHWSSAKAICRIFHGMLHSLKIEIEERLAAEALLMMQEQDESSRAAEKNSRY